jgi:hypothetical protein
LKANIRSKGQNISSIHADNSIAAIKTIEFRIETSDESSLVDRCFLEAVDIVLESNDIDIITLSKIAHDSRLKTCKVIQDIDHAHLAELIFKPISEIEFNSEALDEVKESSERISCNVSACVSNAWDFNSDCDSIQVSSQQLVLIKLIISEFSEIRG